MASRTDMNQGSFIMCDVNGEFKWVTFLGRLGDKKLYQVDYDWLYGNEGSF